MIVMSRFSALSQVLLVAVIVLPLAGALAAALIRNERTGRTLVVPDAVAWVEGRRFTQDAQPGKIIIMEYHNFSILAHMHIQLDPISRLRSRSKSGKGIFWNFSAMQSPVRIGTVSKRLIILRRSVRWTNQQKPEQNKQNNKEHTYQYYRQHIRFLHPN